MTDDDLEQLAHDFNVPLDSVRTMYRDLILSYGEIDEEALRNAFYRQQFITNVKMWTFDELVDALHIITNEVASRHTALDDEFFTHRLDSITGRLQPCVSSQ